MQDTIENRCFIASELNEVATKIFNALPSLGAIGLGKRTRNMGKVPMLRTFWVPNIVNDGAGFKSRTGVGVSRRQARREEPSSDILTLNPDAHRIIRPWFDKK